MKIGMLFPGYSSQYVGMGKELYDNSRIVQEYFEEASNCLGINFVKLCFASSDAELAKSPNAYPALFLVSSAIAHMIQDAYPHITISAVAGYGIGEYSALSTAKVLNFPDGLYLLSKLALFYGAMREELDAKTVIIKGLSAKKLNQLCEEQNTAGCAHIAIYENGTGGHVVTGNSDAVDAVADSATDAGAAKVKEINAEEGFHSPLLQDLAEQLKIYLTKVDFKDPMIPIITGVDAKEICRAKKAQDAIIRHIAEPLYWNSVTKHFADYDLIIVPSPSKELVKQLTALYPDKLIKGIETMEDVAALKEILPAPPVIELEPSAELANDTKCGTATKCDDSEQAASGVMSSDVSNKIDEQIV